MQRWVHATIASVFAWAGNIYDLLIITYVYSDLAKYLGVTTFIGIVFFIIAATGAKRELNLVLVMGAVGLSVLRTLIRFEPNSPQDILDKMHY